MKKKTRAEKTVDDMSDETLKAIGFGVIKAVTIAFLFGALVGYLVRLFTN